MPRPTLAELRQLLDDLGLDSVDPSSFFSGTSNEILRMMIDMGPVKPLPTFNFIQNNTFTTGANTLQSFDITGANPNTIRVVKNLNITIVTANVDEIRLAIFDGTATGVLWNDDTGAPFPTGTYIGSDNDATRAWGAQGLDNIVLYPQELTTNPNNQRQLQIRLVSAVALVKQIVVSMNVTEFDSRLFRGGDW